MTQQELENTITSKFASVNFIDLSTNTHIPVSGNEELEVFFFGINGESLSEVLALGGASMRKDVYKLVGKLEYRTDIPISTFAADVLYFRDINYPMIKFHVNIGPLTNLCVRYLDEIGELVKPEDVLFKQFYQDRLADSSDDYYYNSKYIFYKRLLAQQKLFWVQSNEYYKTPGYEKFKEAYCQFIS